MAADSAGYPLAEIGGEEVSGPFEAAWREVIITTQRNRESDQPALFTYHLTYLLLPTVFLALRLLVIIDT